MFCSFLALVLVDEPKRRLEARGWKLEWEVICQDLEALAEGIGKVVGEVERRVPEVEKRLLTGMRSRLEALLEGGTPGEGIPEALRREVVYWVERADVNEELKRLRSHLGQFRRTLEEGGTVGRRLEFLLQEMHRELNTMASKAQDAEVSALVVEGKVLVERAREQVQNLE